MKSFLTTGLALCSVAQLAAARMRDHKDANAARYQKFAKRQPERRSFEERSKDFRYYTNDTKDYVVESLPLVDFDIGEMYSGNVPIDYNDTSRSLFFVWYPTLGEQVDEITIWLNGGPGCSSLDGFFQENGPFTWRPGTLAPVQNPYSWANLTNMLWVEQPVGTGFSVGNVTATSQQETAADFVKFLKNWQDIFGIKNYKIYVTGESYAGRYVPYISAAILDQNDTTYFNLSGALAYDPCIGDFNAIQEEYVAYPFLEKFNNVLNLNNSYMEYLGDMYEKCGYADYIDKYLTFPASGQQPEIYYNSTYNATTCNIFNLANNALFEVNPCFDIYEITDNCPLLSDVLGFPTELVYDQYNTTYFNRTDVKEAMHAPLNVSWTECSNEQVFIGGPLIDGYYSGGPEGEGDLAADPIQAVLPQVIEATNRVLIGNGDFDMIIITNGTLLAIQNMTWNGKMGFEERPSTPINISYIDLEYQAVFDANGLNGYDGPQGVMGVQHYERGLMWVETYQSGHMQPEFQPRASYAHLQWLLGHTEEVGSTS